MSSGKLILRTVSSALAPDIFACSFSRDGSILRKFAAIIRNAGGTMRMPSTKNIPE